MQRSLRQAIQSNKNLDGLRRFYDGIIYPIAVAVIIFISYALGQELIGETIILLMLAVALLVCSDLKPLFMPLLSFLFIVSPRHVHMAGALAIYSDYYKNAVPYIVGLGVFMVAVFILRFVIWGGVRPLFTKKNSLGWWVLPLIISLMLNGIGNPDYTPKNLIIALLCIVCWYLVYLVFYHNLSRDKKTIDHFFKTCMVINGLLVSELVYVYISNGAFDDGIVTKSELFMGWGIQNNLGGILTVLLPANVYFCFKERSLKRGVVFYLLCLFNLVATVFSLCRSAILVSFLLAFLSIIYILSKAPLKKLYALMTAGLAAIVILVVFIFFDRAMDFFDRLINIQSGSSGRFDLWLAAIEEFIKFPWFGSGFYASRLNSYTGFFPGFYHNTIIEITSTCGVFGIFGYCLYRVKTIEIIFKKRNFYSVFLGATVMALLFGSLLDNHMFNVYPSFYAAIALALCHNDTPDGATP